MNFMSLDRNPVEPNIKIEFMHLFPGPFVIHFEIHRNTF